MKKIVKRRRRRSKQEIASSTNENLLTYKILRDVARVVAFSVQWLDKILASHEKKEVTLIQKHHGPIYVDPNDLPQWQNGPSQKRKPGRPRLHPKK